MRDIDRKKNEAIARHLFGWHWNPVTCYYDTPDSCRDEWELPDFVNDRSLDDMLFERLASLRLQIEFFQSLARVRGRRAELANLPDSYGGLGWSITFDPFLLIWSTPEQRIEAILKMFNVTL